MNAIDEPQEATEKCMRLIKTENLANLLARLESQLNRINHIINKTTKEIVALRIKWKSYTTFDYECVYLEIEEEEYHKLRYEVEDMLKMRNKITDKIYYIKLEYQITLRS